jgi:hypothetical protein
MEIVKRYKWLFIIVLPVLILIVIKSTGISRFRSDVYRWAEPSVKGSNLIKREQIGDLKGDVIIINLDGEKSESGSEGLKSLSISEELILSKANLRIIKGHSGPVLLYSEDISKQARVWMVLSQLGNKNIFILTDKQDDEVIKYKFRPDTIVRPDM